MKEMLALRIQKNCRKQFDTYLNHVHIIRG